MDQHLQDEHDGAVRSADTVQVTEPGGPDGLLRPPPRRRRAPLVAAVLALVLAAGAIGLGIGYAVHGPSTAQVTVPTTPATGVPDLPATLARVAPALVIIDTTLGYESARAAGTGMVVSSSGEVVTNNHVIAGATTIRATDVGNGTTYDASVVGYDVSEDVALLQLKGASGLRTVSYAGSVPRLSDPVVAIGNARGAGRPTAVSGVVTGLDQTITAMSEISGTTERLRGLIETNAAVESGQSGGPLVDAHSAVVGMVTAGSADFTFRDGASQSYAVPAGTFRSVAAEIGAGNASSTIHIGPTAFLGVRVTAAQGAGALIVQVLATSPAAAAGMADGDLVVALAGQTIAGPETLARALDGLQPGAAVQVTLVDQTGTARSVSVTLVSGPPA